MSENKGKLHFISCRASVHCNSPYCVPYSPARTRANFQRVSARKTDANRSFTACLQPILRRNGQSGSLLHDGHDPLLRRLLHPAHRRILQTISPSRFLDQHHSLSVPLSSPLAPRLTSLHPVLLGWIPGGSSNIERFRAISSALTYFLHFSNPRLVHHLQVR